MPDEATAELERRYRRLLLAYPRRYRRLRGLEMLTTLLDAAQPGQRRPQWRDRYNLLLSGLRCRMALPPGTAITVAAVCTAFALGALGAAAGARIGWQGAADLPGDDQARTISRTALPGQPVQAIVRQDMLFGYDYSSTGVERVLVALLGGDDYGPGWVDVTTPPVDDPGVSMPQARQRLRDAGWQVTDVRQTGWGLRINARHGGLAGYVEMSRPGNGNRPPTVISLQRAEPGWVLPLTLVGAAAGALAGWLLTGWAARRTRRRRVVVRAVVMVAAGISLLLLFPPTALAVVGLTVHYLDDPEPFLPFAVWGGYMFIFVRALTVLGLVGLLSIAAGSALPTTDRGVSYRRGGAGLLNRS